MPTKQANKQTDRLTKIITENHLSDNSHAYYGYYNRDFKNPGRGESETRLEATFPISDEERKHLAFSPALENAA